MGLRWTGHLMLPAQLGPLFFCPCSYGWIALLMGVTAVYGIVGGVLSSELFARAHCTCCGARHLRPSLAAGRTTPDSIAQLRRRRVATAPALGLPCCSAPAADATYSPSNQRDVAKRAPPPSLFQEVRAPTVCQASARRESA